MVNIPTNYKMGSGLAATIMGQQAGLEAEQTGLENLYKAGQVPTQMLQGAQAMALLNDPDYIKANTQFQLAATQAKLGDAEKQTAVNGLDRLLIQLQANPDPQAQQQVILQSFREKGVDPTSPMGQAILADPYGKTMEARDKLVSTLAKTPEQVGKEQLASIKGENVLEQIQARGEIQKDLLARRVVASSGGRVPKNMNEYETQLQLYVDKNPQDSEARTKLDELRARRVSEKTAGIEARNAPIMNLLQGRTGGAAPAPQAKGGVIKLD